MADSNINATLASLLADSSARSALNHVAKSRWLRFSELVDKGADPAAGREQAQATIRKLQDLKLIDVEPASIEDFNVVFITADGLETCRKLDRSHVAP